MPEKTYKKILVLQTAFLGDAILTSPLLEALKQVFPDTMLDVLCIPQTADVFNRNPHLHEVLVFRKRNWLLKILSLPLLMFHLRRRHYSMAISVQSSFTSSLLMLVAGIPVRHGFTRQKLLTMAVPHAKGVHKREKILNLIKPFSKSIFSMQTQMYWLEKDIYVAETMRDQEHDMPGTYTLGIAPGSIWPTKCWPEEYFNKLVEVVQQQGIRVFLIGGAQDRALCKRIAGKTNAVNTAGRLSIPGSAVLISMLDVLVTNDSAPLHIANAVQTDVIALFGPTTPRLGFFPFRQHDKIIATELACRPCGRHGAKRCPQGHFNCMKRIGTERVVTEINAVLKRTERAL